MVFVAQGKLVNETRCLRCETVTSREEAFYDLSLEIEQNSSLTACLKNFRYCLGFLADSSKQVKDASLTCLGGHHVATFHV